MNPVIITPAFVSTQPDTGEIAKLGPDAWNAPRRLSGGSPGDLIVADPTSLSGASWTPPAPAIRPDGSVPFTGDQSMGGRRLILLTDPIDLQDAATRSYVDAGVATATANAINRHGTVDFLADQSMRNHRLTDVEDPASLQDAATKAYVDTGDALAIRKDGSVPFTGNQSFGGRRITALADPTGAQDGATKNYVDGTVAAHDSGFRRVYWLGPRLVFPAGASGVNNIWTWDLPANTVDADGETLEFLICGGWGGVGNRQVSISFFQTGLPDWVGMNFASYAGSPNAWLFRTTMLRTAPAYAVIAGLSWVPGVMGYRQPEAALDWTRAFTLNIQMATDAPADGGFTVEMILIRRM
jgi:hypothetical protein